MSKNKLIILIFVLILTAVALVGIFVFKAESKKRMSFENKIKCETYINTIEDKIKNEYDYLNYLGSSAALNKIFYSPKENSCMYIINLHNPSSNPRIYSKIVKDALSHQVVQKFDFDWEDSEEQYGAYNKFLAERKITD